MRFRKRRDEAPREVVVLPDWADLADLESGRILLDDAPEIDVRGLDVLGQGAEEEGDVGRLGEVAFDYFGGGRASVPAPSGGVQLPIPAAPRRPPAASTAPVRALRLVSAPEPEPEGEEPDGEEVPSRVSLFDDGPDDEEDEDD